jgi:tetratricopeptide (TPR) repeat protein
MSSSSDSLAELQEQRDFLLNSLRDLEREHEFGDIDDQDYESLRKEYVSRAASVIRQIEKATSQSQSLALTSDAMTETPKNRNFRRTLFTVILVLAVAGSSGWFVAQQSGQRLAGDSLAGSIEDSTASILSRARATNFVDPKVAIELYTQVLEVDPDNVEALTYRAWLVVLISRSAGDQVKQLAFASASSDLKRAIALDPSYPDAHCFLGITLFRLKNDAKGAKEQLTICSDKNPPAEVKSFVDAIVAEVDAVLDN